MSFKRCARPLFVLTLALALVSATGSAQTRRHDLSLSYGVLSIDQLSDVFTDVVTVVLSFGTFEKRGVKYTGVPFLTYHYSANSRFGFGGAVGGYSSHGLLRIAGEDAGTFDEQNYIGAVELDYHWIMRPNLQVYSGAGFGIRYKHGTYTTDDAHTVNRLLPTFHLNALGVRFGGRVGFFLEAGVGYKGGLLAGVNAQF